MKRHRIKLDRISVSKRNVETSGAKPWKSKERRTAVFESCMFGGPRAAAACRGGARRSSAPRLPTDTAGS